MLSNYVLLLSGNVMMNAWEARASDNVELSEPRHTPFSRSILLTSSAYFLKFSLNSSASLVTYRT